MTVTLLFLEESLQSALTAWAFLHWPARCLTDIRFAITLDRGC